MSKKIINILSVLMIVFFLSLVGCKKTPENTNPDAEGTAYGIVHNGYVGMAKVRIKDNKVVDVEYDEAFLPHTWANVNYEMKEGETLPEDILMYTNNNVNKYYAKYLSIDGKLFTGTVREGDLVLDNNTYSNQTIKYSSDTIPDLFAYLYNSDENCKWYYEAVKAGKVFISDKDGKKLETYTSTNTYGWLKSEGKYWNDKETYPLGWKGNLNALKDYLMGKELTSLDKTKFEKSSEGVEKDGYTYYYWTIDGVVTGVTMVDVYQYYTLAARAYDKAKANMKK